MPDFGNTSVFSQTDANNNTGTAPSWSGSAAPSTLDDAGRALQGAATREWNWRNFTLTAGGTADAKTLTYSVAPASYYNGQRFAFIANTTNTGTCTLNVNSLGAKTIKSMLTGTLTALSASQMVAGMFVEVAYNTADDSFAWVNQNPDVAAASTSAAGTVELATTTEALTGTDATRAVTPDSLAALWEKAADVASAGTISLGEGGYFDITGTTTITDIDFATDKDGRVAWLQFDGALTLTHGANLILPGGANITTAAGDVACFVSEGSDVVRCTVYTKASGQAVVASSASSAVILGDIATTSGASASLGSLVLTDYKVIELWLFAISMSGDGALLVGNSTSDDVAVTPSLSNTRTASGVIKIDLADGKGVGWADTDSALVGLSFDTALSTATTTITVAPASGSFDAGSIRVVGYK